MELIVKYIAKVDVATGQIQSIGFTPGHIPPEGISDGVETIHLRTEDWRNYDNTLTIHEEFYRKEGAWVHRGARPNKYFEWNIEAEEWALDSERLFQELRVERNNRLYNCDWTQIPDAPINSEQVGLWKLYRQSLRDFPDSCTNINSLEGLVWPTPPE